MAAHAPRAGQNCQHQQPCGHTSARRPPRVWGTGRSTAVLPGPHCQATPASPACGLCPRESRRAVAALSRRSLRPPRPRSLPCRAAPRSRTAVCATRRTRARACAALQGMHRVHSVYLPLPYCQLLKIIMYAWVFSLPFVLAKEMGTFLPLIELLIALAFFGIDQVGAELEGPYGIDDNDLPLLHMVPPLPPRLRVAAAAPYHYCLSTRLVPLRHPSPPPTPHPHPIGCLRVSLPPRPTPIPSVASGCLARGRLGHHSARERAELALAAAPTAAGPATARRARAPCHHCAAAAERGEGWTAQRRHVRTSGLLAALAQPACHRLVAPPDGLRALRRCPHAALTLRPGHGEPRGEPHLQPILHPSYYAHTHKRTYLPLQAQIHRRCWNGPGSAALCGAERTVGDHREVQSRGKRAPSRALCVPSVRAARAERTPGADV